MTDAEHFTEHLKKKGILLPDPEERWKDPFAEQRAKAEAEAKVRRQRYMRMECNIALFLETEGLYVYDPDGRITSQELYAIYRNWCLEEEIPLHPAREFWLFVKEHASQYRLVYSLHIPNGNGKRVRGFYGIRPLNHQDRNTTSSC